MLNIMKSLDSVQKRFSKSGLSDYVYKIDLIKFAVNNGNGLLYTTLLDELISVVESDCSVHPIDIEVLKNLR